MPFGIEISVEDVCQFAYLGKYQRWSRGHKARKAKDTKKSEAKAKDSLSEDRHSRGQGQELGQGQGPRTQAQVLSKKKKKVFTKIFQAIFFSKNFSIHKISPIQKIVIFEKIVKFLTSAVNVAFIILQLNMKFGTKKSLKTVLLLL